MTSSGRIHSLAISPQRGEKKLTVEQVQFRVGWGLEGDAHAGSERPVSLLAFESFDEVREAVPEIRPGDFAENITTVGLKLDGITPGAHLRLGDSVVLEVSQIGKECHEACHIKTAVGDCIMPRLGVFAKVEKGGVCRVGDPVRLEVDDV